MKCSLVESSRWCSTLLSVATEDRSQCIEAHIVASTAEDRSQSIEVQIVASTIEDRSRNTKTGLDVEAE